ncbi:hypothetical protein GW17_00017230 [Ensete ventricosum]|nr:hypothetical protein GW17_00017230 [Ensete ventricosum]
MQTARYRAVPPKIGRRWSIEREKGWKKKKRKKRKEEKKDLSPARGPRSCAVAVDGSSAHARRRCLQVAGALSPARGERSRSGGISLVAREEEASRGKEEEREGARRSGRIKRTSMLPNLTTCSLNDPIQEVTTRRRLSFFFVEGRRRLHSSPHSSLKAKDVYDLRPVLRRRRLRPSMSLSNATDEEMENAFF